MHHLRLTQHRLWRLCSYTQVTNKTTTLRQPLYRCFGTTTCKLQEPSSTSMPKKLDPLQFPWLLSNSPRRIKDYPYIKAPSDWAFLNLLPVKLQHALCQWLGHRMLQLNTGDLYFPDQFLVGASLGTRKALENISDFLTQPSDESIEKVNQLIAPTLRDTLLGQAEGCFGQDDKIILDVPQIYDARVGDIWVTLGNVDALEQPGQYDQLRWMTLMVSIKRSKVDELEEPFADYRKRLGQGLMEGAHVAVDVEIDADVRYQVLRPKDDDDDDEVVLFDQGRRTMLVRFETPYFVPATAMVSGRDEYTGEPLNDWNWRISDIDQLVEKQTLDAEHADDDVDN